MGRGIQHRFDVDGFDLDRLDLDRFDLVGFDVVGFDMVRFDVVGFDMVRFDMVRFDMVGFDMVGFDVVGFDVVGFDVVGFDMVRGDVVRGDLVMSKFHKPQRRHHHGIAMTQTRHPRTRSIRWAATRLIAVLAAVLMVVSATAIPDSAAKPKAENTTDSTTPTGDDLGQVKGSMGAVIKQIGAKSLWRQGFTGQGVHVAVIDTGVAPVPALLGPDKVVAMVDLSFEAEIPEAVYLDTNGHGTHMAGIIAGDDPATGFVGVAPDAGIVSVKVGDNTGAVDVSQVIAGIDWVIEHRNATPKNGKDGLNIRVINLSYGTDSTQGYIDDPLARAVERAWHAGIVVVVAVGNDGRPEKGLANPARDPYVIAVGAAELTKNGVSSAKFSTSGDEVRNPDIIAPGVSIQSLRAPGSRIDIEHPEGYVDETLFTGSGSSQAAAVVSGAVALLLEARPELTPDQVKALLTSTAARVPGDITFVGHGIIDIAAAAAAPTPGDEATQNWPRSTGLGSLEAARGNDHVTINGVLLQGEITAIGTPWNPQTWIEASSTDTTWTDAKWTKDNWTGASWTGASWTGASWTGASWTGASWTGASWSGASWTGASWSGASWSGASWSGASWSGASWT